MSYLLDTHAFAWLATDDPLLPRHVRSEILNPDRDVTVSIVSLWEIGIKMSIGKWQLPMNVIGLQTLAEAQSIEIAPVSVDAIHFTTSMDWFNKDPFDRLIAATAVCRGDLLVTAEEPFERWGVRRFW